MKFDPERVKTVPTGAEVGVKLVRVGLDGGEARFTMLTEFSAMPE